jgi:hypothetical protein
MKKSIILLSIVGIIFYFFVFPTPLNREHYFQASKALSLAEIATAEQQHEELVPFLLMPYRGYLNKNFEPVLVLNTPKRSSFSKDYYTLYDETDAPTEVRTSTNIVVSSINDTGVPFIFDKNLYFISNPEGLVNVYAASGSLLWSFDAGSPVHAIDTQGGITLLGLLNGSILFIGPDGILQTEYRPGGSKYEVIYGVALSSDASYAAIISGLEPQRFILFKKGVVGYTPVYHTELSGSFTSTVHLNFSPGRQYVSYEEKNLFNIYDIASGQRNTVPYNGKLRSINSTTFDNFESILSNDGENWFLKIFSFNGRNIILNNKFTAQNAAMLPLDKNKIVLAVNDKLLLIEYKEAFNVIKK